MKTFFLAVLYTASALLANPALADVDAAIAARDGDMKKLNFHSSPKPVGTEEFFTIDGDSLHLKDWQGKWVLVNFWATWCAPCRKEMPMLSELQSELGGTEFEVLTIATTRNKPQAMKQFFEEVGVDNLPLHIDPKSALSREMGVLGLPVTLIVNPEGQEIARLPGDADWASASAREVLQHLIGIPTQ